MWSILILLLWCLQINVLAAVTKKLQNVEQERSRIYHMELDLMLGSDIVLNENELQANHILKELKEKVLNDSFFNQQVFNLSKHFFEYKNAVKESELFKIIQKMPKGAVLHAHDTGILSPDYLVSLTYTENLYICYEENDGQKFLFHKNKPDSACSTKWKLLSDLRNSSENINEFDAHIRKYFTIVVDKPEVAYPNINTVWSKFKNYFIKVAGLLTYKPLWEKYFYETLKVVRGDNIMFIEIRSVLPELYDLAGNVYNSVETAQSYFDVSEKFRKDYPDFCGAKLIYAPLRSVNENTVKKYIEIAREIKGRMPKFFAGFDLVGQEDLGNPTKDFLPALVEAADDLDYFFHAGETNWYGSTSDENLFDAVAIGVKRIGHGYAILKHPLVMEEIRKKNIAIEVNVISNVVLKLVDDVRNHPLAVFLGQGMPVILSSDDPGVWEAEPLSHDFYVTFVGVASRHADLRLLKKLALNSLHYSTSQFKDEMVLEFEKRWNVFIKNLIGKGNIIGHDMTDL